MEDTVKKEIAENIKKIRKAKKMSQKELSEVLNVSTVSIWKWENGTAIPDATYLYDMSKLFGVSMDTFLGQYSFEEKSQRKEKKIIEKIKTLIDELEK